MKYIFNNLFRYICLWYYIFQLTYCSLLSRLKNPYQYAPSSEVDILPEDYEDEMKHLSSQRLVTDDETDMPKFTRKLWNANNEANLWRPSKIMYRSTVTSTEPSTALRAWPTVPWIYLQSRSTTELLTELPPTQSSSATRRSWRPYFPTLNRFKILNHNVWNLASPRKPFSVFLTNSSISRSTPAYRTTVTSKTSLRTVTTTPEPQFLENLTYTHGVGKQTGNTGMMLRIIFNDNNYGTAGRNLVKFQKNRPRKKKPKTTTKATTKAPDPQTCYQCGLQTIVATTDSDCYPVFESPDHAKQYKRHEMVANCGLNYLRGCFKRYLDVGSTYIERGCREMPPKKGNSKYISKKFAKLEMVLEDIPTGCVISPYASLTKFHRHISLYARYHVCICNTHLCNSGSFNDVEKPLFIVVVFSIIYK